MMTLIGRNGFGNDSHAVSLLHCDGANNGITFTESARGGTHTWTPAGNAVTSTAAPKYGTASCSCPAEGTDYISGGDSADWVMALGPWTIDFWLYADNFSGPAGSVQVLSQEQDANNKVYVYVYSSYIIFAGVSGGTTLYIQTNSTLAVTTWYHIAIVKSGAEIMVFLNGVKQSLTTNTAPNTNMADFAANLDIGRAKIGASYYGLRGDVDEFRFSQKIARWTHNFTPPNRPY